MLRVRSGLLLQLVRLTGAVGVGDGLGERGPVVAVGEHAGEQWLE